MKLTPEQEEAVSREGNLILDAVAGSGKTTTLIEYARRRFDKKILYIAFNKTVKEYARNKFAQEGIKNVQTDTSHSYAFRRMQAVRPFKTTHKGYTLPEMLKILKIPVVLGKLSGYTLARHVNNTIAHFCNSDKAKIEEIENDYLNSQDTGEAYEFVNQNWDKIIGLARNFMDKMYHNQIDQTHDFYLKLFHHSKLSLNFDYILFDEGQDASPVMLDVFRRQEHATKVLVGDRHQQIYSWRGAENALEYLDFDVLPLSTSFRFDNEMAQYAVNVIKLKKKYFGGNWEFKMQGAGGNSRPKVSAVLARTNVGLLNAAIEKLHDSKIKFYFEGGFNSYVFSNGTSIFDVLYLFLDKKAKIQNEIVRSMASFEDLERHVEETMDSDLKMICKLVKTHKDELFKLVEELRKKVVEEPAKANYQMSTVHKAKGMEYDMVELTDDYVTEKVLKKVLADDDTNKVKKRLQEELNILYVAVTRAKYSITAPDDIVLILAPELIK